MSKNTITLQGNGVTKEGKFIEADILPGHMVEEAATGIQKHSTAGGSNVRAFAIEDDNQGNDLSDAIAINNQGPYKVFNAGDKVMARLANGETAVIGSKLESNGDGTLRVVDADASAGDIGVQSIVGTAAEAVDLSDSSAADPAAFIGVDIW